MTAAARAHPDRRVAVWSMDEARVGRKGRTGHRWWPRGERPRGERPRGERPRGERPRGECDRRFVSTYPYGAVCPATGEDFALVLPEVSTAAMQAFLDRFAAALAPGTHAALVLDQAGWHGSHRPRAPANVTPVPLPPYSPELNPVERAWLYSREHVLSRRLLDGYEEIVAACCDAWNGPTAERLRSPTSYPWIARVSS